MRFFQWLGSMVSNAIYQGGLHGINRLFEHLEQNTPTVQHNPQGEDDLRRRFANSMPQLTLVVPPVEQPAGQSAEEPVEQIAAKPKKAPAKKPRRSKVA